AYCDRQVHAPFPPRRLPICILTTTSPSARQQPSRRSALRQATHPGARRPSPESFDAGRIACSTGGVFRRVCVQRSACGVFVAERDATIRATGAATVRGPCLAARDQTAGRWPESCSSSSEMTAMAKVTSATVTSVNESIREAIRELTAVREEGRLQRHQFSLQAMQRWNELETELDALEERIGQSGARTLDAVMARTRELTAKVRQFLRRQGASAKDRLATKVRLVMTPNVSTATPADGLNRAAQIMWEGDCGVVPVTESDGSLVGVITDRDVCMAAYTQGQPLAAVPIDAAMARTVFACSPDDTVHQA